MTNDSKPVPATFTDEDIFLLMQDANEKYRTYREFCDIKRLLRQRLKQPFPWQRHHRRPAARPRSPENPGSGTLRTFRPRKKPSIGTLRTFRKEQSSVDTSPVKK